MYVTSKAVGWGWLVEAFFRVPTSDSISAMRSLVSRRRPWDHNLRPSAGVQGILLAVMLNQHAGEVFFHGVSSAHPAPRESISDSDPAEKRFHLPADFSILRRLMLRGVARESGSAPPADQGK
jgi:hypothetical protein